MNRGCRREHQRWLGQASFVGNNVTGAALLLLGACARDSGAPSVFGASIASRLVQLPDGPVLHGPSVVEYPPFHQPGRLHALASRVAV